MATLPTPAECARFVLDIFKHFSARPGHVLQPQNFMAVAANKRWEMSDITQGLQYAVQQGWVQQTSSGAFELTAAGFAEM